MDIEGARAKRARRGNGDALHWRVPKTGSMEGGEGKESKEWWELQERLELRERKV